SEVNAAEVCALGVEIFDRGDLRYIASKGRESDPPKETSYAFPYAGYYVMRDSWRPEAQYLLFDAGGGQTHENKLDFRLHAYGRRLIVDRGKGESGSEGYLRSSRAHNSIIIDGKGQRRRRIGEAEIAPEADLRWIRTASFDFAEGWYKEGYAGEGEDAIACDLAHKRSIFYVRGEYFILHDLVLGEGEHRLEQVFHLAAAGGDGGTRECVERLEGGIVRTVDPNSGNIVIAPTDAAGLEVTLGSGESSSCELAYVTNRLPPTAMNVVLFPSPPGAEVSLEIGLLEVAADADVLATGFTIAHGGFTDYVLISDDGFAEMCTSELEFRGEYAFLRIDGDGQPLWWGLVNGQFLGWRGKAVVGG
ncbi:MAG: heparinase II/III-family protein, partial [Candidatus Poribacteria bacterium]|nr:heparinase II/III-family protein [Candidatus Poribacteria bacterium]